MIGLGSTRSSLFVTHFICATAGEICCFHLGDDGHGGKVSGFSSLVQGVPVELFEDDHD